MRTVLLTIILLLCSGMVFGESASSAQKSLKHHQSWESWALQGLYSNPRCPGQYPMYIYDFDAEGNPIRFFLECWGSRKNDAKY